MAYDFKKHPTYKAKTKPEIINIDKGKFIAVYGSGNPNDTNGEYQKAIIMLYTVAYTIRMSYKTEYKIKDFYEYVVPPLEGYWWQDGILGYDNTKKDQFKWISHIRVPDFVTNEVFSWAIETATKKKKIDLTKVRLENFDEGLCVQMLHIGPFDKEYETVNLMEEFLKQNGYENDFSSNRMHHEIYLSDIRKIDISKMKTIIRHPIKKI